MRTPIAAGLAGLLLALQAFADASMLDQRYQAAWKLLNAKCGDFCGYGLTPDPAEVKALDELWDAAEAQTVAALNAHPDKAPSTKERGAPEKIGPDLFAYTDQWGETGIVYLVGKRDGRWQVVWDIRHADSSRFKLLRAWRSPMAQENCRSTTKETDWGTCGPLAGGVTALKPDNQGRARFVVEATYAQSAGATVGGHISFWRWNGSQAEPLAVGDYLYMIDDPWVLNSPPDTVVVRVKDEFKSFDAGGSGIGRQLDWTFHVLPDRIVDEGKKPVVPELDAIDALLQRIFGGKPTADLASPTATATLRTILGPEPEVDMEIDRHVARTASGSEICLSGLGLPATLFTLERRGEGYFVTSVRAKGTETCTQPAKN